MSADLSRLGAVVGRAADRVLSVSDTAVHLLCGLGGLLERDAGRLDGAGEVAVPCAPDIDLDLAFSSGWLSAVMICWKASGRLPAR
jgi:hypothetical protein